MLTPYNRRRLERLDMLSGREPVKALCERALRERARGSGALNQWFHKAGHHDTHHCY